MQKGVVLLGDDDATQVAGTMRYYATTEKFAAALREALRKVKQISTSCNDSGKIRKIHETAKTKKTWEQVFGRRSN